MTIKSVMVLGNFNVAAFDEEGKQIPGLQENLLTLWADLAKKMGCDPTQVVIETPSGNWRIFDTEIGYNLERV